MFGAAWALQCRHFQEDDAMKKLAALVTTLGLVMAGTAHADDTTTSAGGAETPSRFGAGVGGAYIPTGDGGASVGTLMVHFRTGDAKREFRLSPMYAYADSPKTVTQAALLISEIRFKLGPVYRIGGGALLGYGSVDRKDRFADYETALAGVVLTPAAFELTRHVDLSLTTFMYKEIESGVPMGGGFIGLSVFN
jgi:hypothetical protein